jgi:hypothetical protein
MASAFAMATPIAHAAVITFTFDCTIVSASTCNSGGPFGTLTVSDSSMDPTRVDLQLVVTVPTSATFSGISQFFMNYDTATGPDPTGRQFRIVPITTPSGVNGTSFVTLDGTVAFSSNSLGPPSTANTLDLALNPTSNTITSYTGSLLLRESASGGINTTQLDLDASMFDLTSPTSLLYAAVEGLPSGPTQLRIGATTSVTALPTGSVPAPSSLLLLVTALFGFAFRSRPKF